VSGRLGGPPSLREGRSKEIGRAREVLCDSVYGDNAYSTTLEDLDRYFMHFAVAARNKTA